MIGLGYYDTITPAVIRRNVLENPAWYTAYTPYQPEISQGRLEALLNFQTMVEDLTGLPVAGASLLDEGDRGRRGDGVGAPGGEAGRHASWSTPTSCRRPSTSCGPGPPRSVSTSSCTTSPQPLPDGDVFGVLVQYPGASGAVRDLAPDRRRRRTSAARWSTVAADLLALTLLAAARRGRRRHRGRHARSASACRSASAARTPATWPTRAGLERQLPGRLVGVSVDADGKPAYRLALQTREQHIRREKATQQHLHRAGAARGDRQHVRRLPRAGRAADDRPPGAPVGVDPRRRAARRRRGRGRTRRSSTRSPRGCPARADAVVAARGGRHQPAPGRRRHRVASPATRRPAAGTSSRSGGHSASGSATATSTDCDAVAPTRSVRARAQLAVPDPSGLLRAPLRDRDAALPAHGWPTATTRSTAA